MTRAMVGVAVILAGRARVRGDANMHHAAALGPAARLRGGGWLRRPAALSCPFCTSHTCQLAFGLGVHVCCLVKTAAPTAEKKPVLSKQNGLFQTAQVRVKVERLKL